ncbi:MAG: hypothetical protein NTV06_06175, partial [candidate division Zixibacteria bacterium]|nr:hypothetical protein [candidate division Zixibacteria bacterium]
AIDAYTAALNLQPKGKTKSLIRAHLDRLISGRIKKEAVLAIENEAKVKAESLPPNTIAVVNFDGSHLPPDMAPIAGGLAEFTSMDLTKVKMLRVVDRLKIDAIQNELRLSSSVYADPTYAPKLGRMLGSHNVITGTLLSIGDNGLRLDGIIVNTVDASTRQTTPTEGEVNGFFKIQKAFVFKIIDDMGITLSPEERDAIQKIPTESYLAFMAYCRGLDYKNRGLDQEARQAFHQAAQTDKTFKEAATQSRELSASAGVKGEASNFERFESSVETETAKEQTATGLDQKLSDVVNNAGVIPDLSHPGTVLAQPVIGSTGPVIIKGDLDGN